MKDAWILVDADGRECGRGEGPPGQHAHGERVIWCDDRAAVDAHPLAVNSREREQADAALTELAAQNRAQAFALKTLSARAYLREVPEAPGMQYLADCIDPELYPELYEEYWNTYDQVPWTPHELARRISAKAAAASGSESALRRAKLLAEARLAQPIPTADESEIAH